MESLLHWDFSPGLAVKAQVRSRFKSTVHFSPSPTTKEFFLVVSFSSASFSLTEESVGLALQSCIGGISSGFKVTKLSDRRFRFSVASNRVGHFIYGLRDRVWPDFVCHFHLFRGSVDLSVGLSDSSWHADTELSEIGSSPGLAIRSKWLHSQRNTQIDPSSVNVIQKFGLVPLPPANLTGDAPIPKGISFGSFEFPVISDESQDFRFGEFSFHFSGRISSNLPSFKGNQFRQNYWDSLPDETLYHILDGWQAGYSDAEVKVMVQIVDVPTAAYIDNRLLRCTKCGRLGHLSPACPGVFCFHCYNPDDQCVCDRTDNAVDTSSRLHGDSSILDHHSRGPTCMACSRVGHSVFGCPGLMRCASCQRLGHLGCSGNPAGPYFIWKPKITRPPQISGITRGKAEACLVENINMIRVARDYYAKLGGKSWVVK